MKYLWLLVLLYCALIAQSSVAPAIAIGASVPDFLLMLLVAVVVLLDGWPVIVWAAGIGLAADCLAPDRLGIGVVTATVAALVAQRLRGERGAGSAVSITLATFLIVLTVSLTACLTQAALSNRPADLKTVALFASGSAVYSAAVSLALIAIGRTAKRLLPRSETDAAGEFVNRWKMLTD